MPPYVRGGHLQVPAKSIFCAAQKPSFQLWPRLPDSGLMCGMLCPKKTAAVQSSAVITLVELPSRHHVWRRHFRLHLRMEHLDLPSKRQTFQLDETSLGGNGGITSAPNDVLVVLVARRGEQSTEKEVYPRAADNDSARWSKHPCELSGLVP